MTGQSIFWAAAISLLLWFGNATLMTGLGRSDKRAWPVHWSKVFVAWLIVSIPPMALLAITLATGTTSIPALILISCAAAATWAAGWKWGGSLPLLGRWVRVLRAREAERADKGIL